ncbi:hypothetical protein [uncultured Umboniibacter sp.]|uniref:hypothetical protein n=1 Tax=uncultured Umboniibacter sp. TaxID=1798917 RepID=UPI002609B347|nr:hypothetical protein [uncultured Umboniibacter sp.]
MALGALILITFLGCAYGIIGLKRLQGMSRLCSSARKERYIDALFFYLMNAFGLVFFLLVGGIRLVGVVA